MYKFLLDYPELYKSVFTITQLSAQFKKPYMTQVHHLDLIYSFRSAALKFQENYVLIMPHLNKDQLILTEKLADSVDDIQNVLKLYMKYGEQNDLTIEKEMKLLMSIIR